LAENRVGIWIRIRVRVDFVVVFDGTGDWSGVAPDPPRDFEGGFVVRALEGDFLAVADFGDDVAVLLLQPPELLDELVLVESELKLRLDLVVEQSGVVVVRGSSLRRVVQKPLQEPNFVLVRPQTLEQSPRIVQRFFLLDLLRARPLRGGIGDNDRS